MATIAKQLTGGTPPMDPYRRRLIAGAGVAGVAGVLSIIPLASVAATPAQLKAALEMITGGATVTPGRVKLEIAPLVESGFTVPCKVSVASTMKGADRVQAIHILKTANAAEGITRLQPAVEALITFAGIGLPIVEGSVQQKHPLLGQQSTDAGKQGFHFMPMHDVRGIGREYRIHVHLGPYGVTDIQ